MDVEWHVGGRGRVEKEGRAWPENERTNERTGKKLQSKNAKRETFGEEEEDKTKKKKKKNKEEWTDLETWCRRRVVSKKRILIISQRLRTNIVWLARDRVAKRSAALRFASARPRNYPFAGIYCCYIGYHGDHHATISCVCVLRFFLLRFFFFCWFDFKTSI